MKDTSLDAFYEHKKSTKLQAQQLKIVSVMQPAKVYTRRELAKLSGIETSTVSARVNSMIDTVIEIVGTKKDPLTNKTVEALMLKVAA
jgi:predicted HTH transcriptional regulator